MKKILAAILATVAVMGMSAYAKTIQVTIDSPDVFTSDEYILKSTLQAAAYIENDITMVPLRFITEELGAEVQWNHDTKEITISKDDNVITLQIGNINAVSVANGETKASELLAPPVIVNDITLVPLRFVSENMGASVEYIAPTRQVLISDDGPAIIVGSTPVSRDMFRTFYLANYQYIELLGAEYVVEAAYSEIVTNFAISNNWQVIDPNTDLSEESLATINSQTDDEYALMGILRANLVKLMQNVEIANRAYEMLSTATPDEELENIYAENFVCAKHVLISKINLDTYEDLPEAEKKKAKQTAELVLKKAKGGADFDKLIAEYGEDPGTEHNPDGYVFTYDEMVPEFEEAAFALEENEISGIVETDYGYHIIKKLPLPPITAEIKALLGNEAAMRMIDYIIANTPVTEKMSVEELTEYMLASTVG